MSQTFANAVTFNQDLSNWDVSQVTSMPEMFQSATAFHQVVSDWNVSNVLDMTNMFSDALPVLITASTNGRTFSTRKRR